MALPESGILNLSDIQTEFGGDNPIGMGEYYRGGTYTTSNNTSVPTSGAINFTNFYGATRLFTLTISTNTQEADLSALATAAGWDGSAPLEVFINSSIYVWSDSISTPALLVNVNNAVIFNSGLIMGRGGNGGTSRGTGNINAQAGGSAINVTATGVLLTNNASAFIAGGGGGGAYATGVASGQTWRSGGGGGAGGGLGGTTTNGSTGTLGGAIGQSGSNGALGSPLAENGQGGGSGGGGAASRQADNRDGGGGGRILSGTGGTGGRTTASLSANGGDGGSAGAVGGIGIKNPNDTFAAGGGGGWGASGGRNGQPSGSSGSLAGGVGGAAISGNSVTLTDNGTVYGSVA
jgi:hypothetical protein